MQPPIASPFGAPEVPPEEQRVFRPTFWRAYRSMLAIMIVLLPLMGMWFWFNAPQMFTGQNRQFMAVMFFFMLVTYPLFGALGLRARSIKVTPSGLQGIALVGFVEWERIKSVRAQWMPPVYIRVNVRNGFIPLMIPTLIARDPDFAATLEEWAPHGNPLREWALKRARR